MNSKISKSRRKELRKKYEVEVGKKFFKEVEKQPVCSSFEWVELICNQKD